MKVRLYLAILVTAVLGLVAPSTVSAQAITSYEVAIAPSTGGGVVKTLAIPAVSVSCVSGQSTTPLTALWLQPADTLKVEFEPDTTRVCSYTGPAASTLNLSVGTQYTAVVVAINEAGLRSDASPASNPFGVAGKPATIRRVVVSKGS